MLPGTWAYVSAGAFGRAIIVSFSLLFCYIVNSTHIWATFLRFNYFVSNQHSKNWIGLIIIL
jgi:hypothetical protein